MLFADSLAKLPYKIGGIRDILARLVGELGEVRAGRSVKVYMLLQIAL